MLGQEEQARALRFRFPHLTHDFVVDHGRMRLILGAYAGIAPDGLVFIVNEFGKPELVDAQAVGPHGRLRFNLSHTKGLTLLAVCLDSDLGVDVEAVRSMSDFEDIAESHFSRREIASLRAVDPSDRQRAFFRCWTRKEALLKAHGRGLSIPLDSFAVSLTAEERPALLEYREGPEETSRWSLFSLDLGREFVAALAIKRADWQIRLLDWP